MSCVAVKHGCVTVVNLSWVAEDNDLGVEGFAFLGGLVITVGGLNTFSRAALKTGREL